MTSPDAPQATLRPSCFLGGIGGGAGNRRTSGLGVLYERFEAEELGAVSGKMLVGLVLSLLSTERAMRYPSCWIEFQAISSDVGDRDIENLNKCRPRKDDG